MSITATTTEPTTETLAYQLRDLIVELWDNDPQEIALDYSYLLTQSKRENLLSSIKEFQQTLDERNSYSDEAGDVEEALADSVLQTISRVLQEGFTTDEAKAINKAFNEVFAKYGEGTTKHDTDEMIGEMLHQILFTNDELDVIDEMYENPLETDEWKQVCKKAYSC